MTSPRRAPPSCRDRRGGDPTAGCGRQRLGRQHIPRAADTVSHPCDAGMAPPPPAAISAVPPDANTAPPASPAKPSLPPTAVEHTSSSPHGAPAPGGPRNQRRTHLRYRYPAAPLRPRTSKYDRKQMDSSISSIRRRRAKAATATTRRGTTDMHARGWAAMPARPTAAFLRRAGRPPRSASRPSTRCRSLRRSHRTRSPSGRPRGSRPWHSHHTESTPEYHLCSAPPITRTLLHRDTARSQRQ